MKKLRLQLNYTAIWEITNNPGARYVEVDDETAARWDRVEAEFFEMQGEISLLPETEFREPGE